MAAWFTVRIRTKKTMMEIIYTLNIYDIELFIMQVPKKYL